MTSHLTPEQLVDLADGTQPETSLPHVAACDDCRRQLAGMRAMMSDAADVRVPEPSPQFWSQLAGRVREAVDAEAARAPSWRERLRQPFVLVPALAGALAVALVAVVLPHAPFTTAPPSPASPVAGTATLPSPAVNTALPPLPPIAPLGSADDPQLNLVAAYGSTLDWVEMRDEVALSAPGSSSAVVVGALTVDEQRELQRLLAEELAQPRTLETRS